MGTTTRRGLSEDWLAVILGLVITLLSMGAFAGADLLGWAAKTSEWTNPAQAVASGSSARGAPLHLWKVTRADGKRVPSGRLDAPLSLLCTFLFALGLMTAGALALRASLRRRAR